MSVAQKARDRDRKERLQALQRQQRAAERRRTLLIIGAAAVVVLLIAGSTTWAVVSDRRKQQAVAAAARKPIEGVKDLGKLTQNHVEGRVNYPQTPPAGGNHAPVWLNCGTYNKPVPSENAVHSLEHGAVWVTYRPDLSKAAVDKLKAAMPSTYVILSPYPGLPSPIVASAWARQLTLDSPDDPRLATFIRAFRQGQQAPEPGAPCTGGITAEGAQ